MKIENKKQATIGVFIALGLLTFGVVATANQGDSREQLENQYKTNVNQAHQLINEACDIEVSLAKLKLADHYLGKIKLENIDKLKDKAEGKNLDCKSGF